ncbi:hypothetical protein HOL63_01255 [Candidatus Peregrinibacteria bacterium]|jgi:hypothetical protein|nr:hypothetical protein [Candidatus Peregrinibacteria bacterium]MBT5468859.1 hypothetical protein [Candidatus Peregrinibacteria bacterium]MBT7338011.1 hypothetical protein [Candidatus Peregrinibacteria bacterium]
MQNLFLVIHPVHPIDTTLGTPLLQAIKWLLTFDTEKRCVKLFSQPQNAWINEGLLYVELDYRANPFGAELSRTVTESNRGIKECRIIAPVLA